MVTATPRSLYTRDRDSSPVVREAGLASGSVWMGTKNLSLSGCEPRTIQPRASHYTTYAVAATLTPIRTSGTINV